MVSRRARRESEESWSLSDAADFLIQRIDQRLGEKRLPEYFTDPVRFVREVIKTEPTAEQVEILTALVQNNHVAVRSGHGIGKTSCLAFAILWFLTTRMFAKIPVTAPTSHQLEDILWGELVKLSRNMEPSFRDQWDYTSDKFFHKQHSNEWYCVARTARKGRPEALQGFHGENLFFILEEAAGIPDEAPAPNPTVAVGELRPGIFVCGEYGSLPSIQWALMSGRLAAEAVLAAATQRDKL